MIANTILLNNKKCMQTLSRFRQNGVALCFFVDYRLRQHFLLLGIKTVLNMNFRSINIILLAALLTGCSDLDETIEAVYKKEFDNKPPTIFAWKSSYKVINLIII